MSEVDMRACVVCGRRRELEYHHRNGNARDDSVENGVCLCRRCHVAIHAEKNRQRNRARRSRDLQTLRARVQAAEKRIADVAPHLKRHCEKCGGYARQSSATNDEPPCANCPIGFVVQDLELEKAVWPEEYR